jgi:hypothetical protein
VNVEPTVGVEYLPQGSHGWRPFVSYDGRLRTVYNYEKTSADQREDRQFSSSLVVGLRQLKWANKGAPEFHRARLLRRQSERTVPIAVGLLDVGDRAAVPALRRIHPQMRPTRALALLFVVGLCQAIALSQSLQPPTESSLSRNPSLVDDWANRLQAGEPKDRAAAEDAAGPRGAAFATFVEAIPDPWSIRTSTRWRLKSSSGSVLLPFRCWRTCWDTSGTPSGAVPSAN